MLCNGAILPINRHSLSLPIFTPSLLQMLQDLGSYIFPGDAAQTQALIHAELPCYFSFRGSQYFYVNLAWLDCIVLYRYINDFVLEPFISGWVGSSKAQDFRTMYGDFFLQHAFRMERDSAEIFEAGLWRTRFSAFAWVRVWSRKG